MEDMTMERWNELSDADRMLLKQLGVCPDEPKERVKKAVNPITLERRMSTRSTCPAEEYYIKVFKHCGCCGTKTLVHGRMIRKKPSDSFLSLVLVEIPENESFRQIKTTSINCEKCADVLGALSVEELVERVKILHEIKALRGPA